MTTNFTNEQRLEMLAELKGSKCYCDARKAKMATFCRQQYSSLPPRMRSALYQRFGERYEEAYTAAREWLGQQTMEVKGQ